MFLIWDWMWDFVLFSAPFSLTILAFVLYYMLKQATGEVNSGIPKNYRRHVLPPRKTVIKHVGDFAKSGFLHVYEKGKNRTDGAFVKRFVVLDEVTGEVVIYTSPQSTITAPRYKWYLDKECAATIRAAHPRQRYYIFELHRSVSSKTLVFRTLSSTVAEQWISSIRNVIAGYPVQKNHQGVAIEV